MQVTQPIHLYVTGKPQSGVIITSRRTQNHFVFYNYPKECLIIDVVFFICTSLTKIFIVLNFGEIIKHLFVKRRNHQFNALMDFFLKYLLSNSRIKTHFLYNLKVSKWRSILKCDGKPFYFFFPQKVYYSRYRYMYMQRRWRHALDIYNFKTETYYSNAYDVCWIHREITTSARPNFTRNTNIFYLKSFRTDCTIHFTFL